MDETLKKRIQDAIDAHSVVLFMKGTKEMPQCGFSAQVVAILKHLDVSFETYNVLTEVELRQGMKDFSDWPTFPQLYVQGEFIGGCDIVCELFESGELQKTLASVTA